MKSFKALTTIEAVLFLIILFIFGILAFLYGKNVNTTQDAALITEPIDITAQTTLMPEKSTQASMTQFDWSTVTKEQQLAIMNEGVGSGNTNYIIEDMFGFEKSVDMTGDGVNEGIFGFNPGNAGSIRIFSKNKNGKIVQLEKEGGQPVSPYSVGRVMVNIGYKLLPSEHAFYEYSKDFNEKKSMNADVSYFDCHGVTAYLWNESKEVFVENKALSEKYSKQPCNQY